MGGSSPVLLRHFILFLHYLLFFLLIITTSHYLMLVHSFPSLHQQNPLCHHDDSSALIHFNQSLSIIKYRPRFTDASAYPKVASWNTSSSDCCSWDGVTCDDDTGRVIGLDLSSSFLSGFINTSSILFHLVHLQTLNLADNYFNESQIPSAIGLLSRLTYLNLSNSEFAGQIPLEFSNLTKLNSLDLSRNYFLEILKPGLASLVQNLTDLKQLHLSEVNISSPVHVLANFSSLTSLLLDFCRLQGEFPAGIFKLPNLQFLSVRYNPDLSGYLPEFSRRSPLEELRLAETNFSGEMPNSIRYLESLNHLDISYCNFSGSMLSSISNLSQLLHLELSGNNFSAGSIPSWIGNLTQLESLYLSSTQLTGQIPSWLMNMTQLTSLVLSENNFSAGSIPPWIGNLTQLETLSMRSTQLTGQIPSWLMNLTQLTSLDLSENNFLAGSIPSWIGNLSQLESLYLSSTQLTGQIPSWLMNMTQLTSLVLSENNFSAGSIPPWIGNLTQLETLSMRSTQLTGQIPSWLMNLTQLTWLDLSYNMLHGPIPESMSQFVNLRFLFIGFNNLSGRVKPDLFLTLKNLIALQLSYNQLTLLSHSDYTNSTLPKFGYLQLASCNLTEFPDFLKTQDQLWHLNLSNNRIQGPLPTWIWNMNTQTLDILDLSQNHITGFQQPPPLVLPWDQLFILDLSSNMLEGSLPVPPPSTWFYSVADNKLTGTIPPLICNASSLSVLDLSYNNLSGIIPQCLGSFADSLELLNLRNNKLRGPIPRTFKDGTKLRMISLSQNQLQGTVPKSLVNCSLLDSLDLGNNYINDIFPFWLGTLPKLKVLILQFNRFHGSLLNPNSSFAFPKLQILDLSHNGFTGQLPSDYFHTWTAMKTIDVNQSKYLWREENGYENYSTYTITLTNKGVPTVYLYIPNSFTAIDLSSNRFEGEIPDSIGIFKGLHMLRLSDNNLTGHIPSSLGNLMQLESLDISQNKLTGGIPQQLTQLTFLEFFNVSNNHLTGPIPRVSQFNTFESSSYEGNSGLCGDPLPKKCGNSEASLPPPQPWKFNQDDDHSWFGIDRSDWIVICMGYGGGLVVGFIIGHTQTTRYHEWFVDTFGRNQKNQRRKKKSGRRS